MFIFVLQIQWLLDMLEEAGLLKEKVRHKMPDLQHLCSSTKSAPMPGDIAAALQTLFGPITVGNITWYNQAKRVIHEKEYIYAPGSKSSSVVYVRSTNHFFVGEIVKLFPYTHYTKTYEFAYMKWLGRAELCIDSGCYVVKPLRASLLCITYIRRLSAPLVHVWEDELLWFPRLSHSDN